MAKKPRRANLKGPGHCIFCNSTGLTHEHMWADWLKTYIPRTVSIHRTRTAHVHPTKGEEVSYQRRPGDPHSRRIYCVCGPCNNGWMSKLQEAAKPFLVPMLIGDRTALHRRGQRTVAAWVAMTVMVAEHINRQLVAIPQSDREWLAANLLPPNHWRIWIGAHNNQTYPFYSHHVLEFSEEEIERPSDRPSTAPNTQTTAICLGQNLIIYAMSSVIGRGLVRRWKLHRDLTNAMHQIWPVRTSSVPWSLDRRLTAAAVEHLAEDFLRRVTIYLRHRYRADMMP